MNKNILKITVANLFLAIFSSEAMAREHIQIVGSSTMFPLITAVAEEFSLNNDFKTPVVESNGTGGGIQLFCAGVGDKYPDFVNASRKMSKSEIARCNENDVSKIVEIKIGYDGIALANSNEGPALRLSKRQLFLALSEQVPSNGKLVQNFYKKWNQIDRSLPDQQIEVYGPPPTSGTRDIFTEMVMQESCVNLAEFKEAYPDERTRKRACRNIRSDGKFIEAGENDNLIVRKLQINKDAMGIFGFNFLEQNKETIQGSFIDGVNPTFESIISEQYPVSRPLFVYFKKEHLNQAPRIKDFIKELIDPAAIGENGYLVEKSLVPMSENELNLITKGVLSKI